MMTQGHDVKQVRTEQNSRLVIEGKNGFQIFRESSRGLDKMRKSVIQ